MRDAAYSSVSIERLPAPKRVHLEETFRVPFGSSEVGEQRGNLPRTFSVSVRGEIRSLVLTLWIDCKH